jgi:hypothetical protein
MATQNIYDLETPKERRMRYIINAAIIVGILIGARIALPFLTDTFRTITDFAVEAWKLALVIGVTAFVVVSLWLLRGVLLQRYKSFIKKVTRALITTDLPGLLEVVVDNRRRVLARFKVSVGKMREALLGTERKIEEYKEKAEKKLKAAEYEKKQADATTDAHEKAKKLDRAKHLAGQAQLDKKTLESLQTSKIKKQRSYQFFDRLKDQLEYSTEAVSNQIARLRDELESSESRRLVSIFTTWSK